jgi:hypothetical protein
MSKNVMSYNRVFWTCLFVIFSKPFDQQTYVQHTFCKKAMFGLLTK